MVTNTAFSLSGPGQSLVHLSIVKSRAESSRGATGTLGRCWIMMLHHFRSWTVNYWQWHQGLRERGSILQWAAFVRKTVRQGKNGVLYQTPGLHRGSVNSWARGWPCCFTALQHSLGLCQVSPVTSHGLRATAQTGAALVSSYGQPKEGMTGCLFSKTSNILQEEKKKPMFAA